MATIWQPPDIGASFRPDLCYVYYTGLAGDEMLDPDAIPLTCTWGSSGQISALTIKRQLGIGPGRAFQGSTEDELWLGARPGDRVTLKRGEDILFVGYVGQKRILIQADRDAEECTQTAYGPEILLQGKAVYGQWHSRTTQYDDACLGTFSDADAVFCLTGDAPTGFQSWHPVIFNEGGLPNASWFTVCIGQEEYVEAADKCRVFVPAGAEIRIKSGGGDYLAATYKAQHWTAYEAARSLVEFYDGYDVIATETDWGEIETLLGSTPIREVNVDGMSLLEALAAVLKPVGFGYCIEPWPVVPGVYKHRLQVFPLHPVVNSIDGDTPNIAVGMPWLAPRGTVGGSPTAQGAEVERIEFVCDSHNVRNQVIVCGDLAQYQIVAQYQATDYTLAPLFDETPATLSDWFDGTDMGPDTVAESGDYTQEHFLQRFSRSGSDHTDHAMMWRTFTFNEAKDTSTQYPGDLDDLNVAVAGATDYLRRHRAVGRTLMPMDGVRTESTWPARVEFGISAYASGVYTEDADSWIDVKDAVTIDKDRITIHVNRDNILDWYPWADSELLKDTYGDYSYLTLLYNTLLLASGGAPADHCLMIRLAGSIQSDYALTATSARQDGSAWPFTSTRFVRDNRSAYRAVPTGNEWGSGTADTRNDSAAIVAFAEAVRDAEEDSMGHGSITLRGIRQSYPVGIAVPETFGRVVSLAVDGGRQIYAPVIVELVWDLREGAYKTELMLDSPVLKLTR